MGKFYTKDSIDRLLSIVDIVEVVSDKVDLKKSGTSFKGRCPFHQEKTSSFFVSRDKNIFKCFGCGEAGDSLKFIMKYEGFNFIEAVEFLAQKFHFTLDEENKNSKEHSKRDRIIDINKKSLKHFRKNLKSGQSVVDLFIKKRSLNDEIIEKFNIGYAIDSYKDLYTILKRDYYSNQELVDSGVIKRSQYGDFIDRFRNRIIFPIYDQFGKPVAFGGRALSNKEGVPKYINSPETAVYLKSDILYGLNIAKRAIQMEQFVIVVEGYLDVISLNKYGFENVVAPCGTALTENQIKLLKRYTKKMVLCFDGDKAGKQAALKMLLPTLKNDINCKVVNLPLEEDPDTYINNFGAEAFKHYIETAEVDILDFYIKYQKSVEKNSSIIAQKMVDLVVDIEDPIVMEITFKEISKQLDITVDSLKDHFRRSKVKKSYKNSSKISNIKTVVEDRNITVIEKELLNIFLQYPSLLSNLLIYQFENDTIKTVLAILQESIIDDSFISRDSFLKKLETILTLKQINYLKSLNPPKFGENLEMVKEIINDYFDKINKLKIKREIDILTNDIKLLKKQYSGVDKDQDYIRLLNDKNSKILELTKTIHSSERGVYVK